MPGAKPDEKEISKLLRERNDITGENIFADIYHACRLAVEDGFIDRERADNLRHYLIQSGHASTVFPNSFLLWLLECICADGGWTQDLEKLLLDIISGWYLGFPQSSLQAGHSFTIKAVAQDVVIETHPVIRPPSYDFALSDFLKRDDGIADKARTLFFDAMPPDLDITARFVCFTGTFPGFSRRTCFEEVRKRGGVPSDPRNYLDYFFAADKASVLRGGISSKTSHAVHLRHLYGRLKIFSGEDWARFVGGDSEAR